MSKYPEHIEELIGKVLSGEASEKERSELNLWLNEDETHRRYFRQLEMIFNKSGALKEWQEFDTDEAWLKVKSKLGARQIRMAPQKSYAAYWQIAASVVLLIGIGVFSWFRFFAPRDQVAITAIESSIEESLPDGTRIVVNKGSTLSYTYQPVNNRRVVVLEGEAHFDINNKEESFLIETGDLFIRDIGTVFNVNAYPQRETTEVIVEEGEVELFTKDNPGIRVSAGETGVYNRKTGTFAKLAVVDENALAYKTGVFVFRDAPLDDVLISINEVYEKKLRLTNPALGKCRITVTFRNEKIDVIASIISETLKFTLTETEEAFLLDGERCPE